MLSRRASRRIALQILFANEFLREDIDSVAMRVSESLDETLSPFARELVQKTAENEEDLNELIRKHLRNWDYKRVAFLDRVLIRLALCEIKYFPDIPVEVTINEALEISKDFSNLKSRRFVNGILDSIYKELQSTNLLSKHPHLKIPLNRKKKHERKGSTE
ncbi:MAG TPA: transcription antitermination factor NusB [Calditrichia bacterium]|nr:transcription antitermination factor NusB [Calditrichia bacterium]HQV30577.1 transcription antitermination factor NusB [Calditrichia bacterium]